MKRMTLGFIVAGSLFLISVIWLRMVYLLPFKSTISIFGGPGTYPFIVLCIMTGGSFIVTAGELLKILRGASEGPQAKKNDFLRVGALFAASVGYVAVIEFAGYFLSTVLLLFFALLLFGERNKAVLAGASIAFPAMIYALFKMLLDIQLP